MSNYSVDLRTGCVVIADRFVIVSSDAYRDLVTGRIAAIPPDISMGDFCDRLLNIAKGVGA